MLVAHFQRRKHVIESVVEILVEFFDVIARYEFAGIETSIGEQRLLHMRFGGGVAIRRRVCVLGYME